jgi:hypothetical protein
MADFAPKKESGKAKGGQGPAMAGSRNAEHQAPPVVHLEHHHLEKLGMDKMPPVGSKIKISGLAHVGATSEHNHSAEPGEPEGSGQSTPRRSMTLHLHQMEMGKSGIEGAKDVDQEAKSAAGAKAEMDKALSREMGGKKSKRAEGAQGGPSKTPRGGGD